jgi:hypothetical protein
MASMCCCCCCDSNADVPAATGAMRGQLSGCSCE